MITRWHPLAVMLSVLLLLPAQSSILAQPAPAPAFTWAMADRFGASRQAFAPVPVVTPTAEDIHAQQRVVQFDACATSPASTYAWRIDGRPPVQAGCRYDHTFSALGQHQIELSVTRLGSTVVSTQTIELRDHLVVSFGDSYASGEGVPDVAGDYVIKFPPCRQDGNFVLTQPCVQAVNRSAQWSNAVCHRSSWAGPAQAALAIEQGDPHSTVTFVSLACSGARIEQGLLGPHRGQPPQVDALVRLLCSVPAGCSRPEQLRRVDALVISIGGNDLRFSEIITYCAKSIFGCTGVHLTEDSPVSEAQQALASIGSKYVQLFRSINDRLNVSAVYLTENADPTLGDRGEPCSIGGFPYGLRIASSDVAWLREHLLQKLNTIERTSARVLGWVFIDGIAEQFNGHGYCATERWFVTYPESWSRQGDDEGTMHPNQRGHQVYARRIADVVGPALRR